MAQFNRPIGTRDFSPREMAARRELEAVLRQTFRTFSYHEIQTPTFEDLALFTSKSGEGVISELYAFKDKGERDLTLRPELTAPTMRYYFAEHFNDPKPVKWFYFGNCFRYDRPQAGRYREFWQFGCEQIGAGTPLAYAELLALADSCLRASGLRSREMYVGHVGILKAAVARFGLDDAQRGRLMRAIDKQDTAAMAEIAQAAGAQGPRALHILHDLMAAPDVAAARGAWEGWEGEDLSALFDELEATLRQARALGVGDIRLNLGIARGLDYYTSIVFEVHCPILGAQKQLLGGGGYDLSGIFGSAPVPTMGFGLGFDRTLVALEEESKLDGHAIGTDLVHGPAYYFAALGDEALEAVLPVVTQLRGQGVGVELDLLARKPGSVAKHADAIGARHLVIVGDRDLAAGVVQVKTLSTGATRAMSLADVAEGAGHSRE